MNHRPLRSAMALSLGALLAFAGGAAADTARADGDALTTDIIDAAPYLAPFAPGEVRSIDVRIVLTCTGTSHMDPGQTITAGIDSAVAPEGGAILSYTDATVGPVPATWPADGTSCPSPITFSEGTPSVLTIQAPIAPGIGYRFSFQYHRSFDPFGLNDPLAIRQLTAVDFLLDVVVNTPPTLTLPAVAGAGPVEANTTGGWTADWSGLGATDAEDASDPTPACDPAAGAVLPLGTTSVTCAVTDGGGLSDSGTFDVTVQDTTAPTLTDMPGDRNLTTGDPSGATLMYAGPGATDIADADPAVGCLPASGSHIDVATTKVTCTATDASGNKAQASFRVTVAYVAPHVASATWGEPVAGSDSTFVANRGRNIPVKVELFVDGAARSSRDARLTVTPCGGGNAVTIALLHGTSRWSAALDTTGLVGSCHTVAASIDGLQAGAFRLELRGTEPAKANNQPTTPTTQSTKTKTEKTKP